MVTPRDNAEILNEWRKYWATRRAENAASLHRICEELGRAYGCSVTTVRGYLDEKFAKSRRETSRSCQRQLYARRKAERQYNSTYRRITRNPLKYLVEPAFSGKGSATLDEVTAELRSLTSQNWRPRTIEKILQRFAASEENSAGEPPRLSYDSSSGKWRYVAAPDPGAPRLPLLVICGSPFVAILVRIRRLWNCSRRRVAPPSFRRDSS